jgi:hypothetical protein
MLALQLMSFQLLKPFASPPGDRSGGFPESHVELLPRGMGVSPHMSFTPELVN